MNEWAQALLPAFLLALASSVDAFAASFAYGAGKIRVPAASLLAVSGICSAALALSSLLGGLLSPLLPERFTAFFSFGLLFCLGLFKLFDSSVKRFIRTHRNRKKEIHFSACRLNFILQVYADPQDADRDASQVLSPKEAASLAAALSLDGLAAGFGAGLGQGDARLAFALSFAATALAVLLGGRLGGCVAKRSGRELSWVSGALLIFLSLLKLSPR